MASDANAINQAELRKVFKALKGMGDEAKEEAKRDSNALAEYGQKQIIAAASNRGQVANKIATGSSIKKSSTIGEVTFGFASQKFSGGANTRTLWGGTEFGSNKFRQFPPWSGSNPSGGAGSKGYFIYPTLRKIQPHIVAQWTESFTKILAKFT